MIKILKNLNSIRNIYLVKLITPKNISYFWNGGRFLGILIIIQIITGIILTFFFRNSAPFDSIEYFIRNTNIGFFIRWAHINGASYIFFILFFHIFRGLYYNSFNIKITWVTGVILFVLLILISFLGYVLPFGQISFWAATVITKFVGVIPVLGPKLLIWLWTGFRVNILTLKFFFSLHFLIPFVIIVVVVIHLFRLNISSRSNPLFFFSHTSIISFFPKFIFKDFSNIIFFFVLFFVLNYSIFFEAVNFIKANPIISPTHIKPEWYFLFAYGILRRVPDKLAGIILILFSVLCFFKFSFFKYNFLFSNFKNLNKLFFFCFFFNFLILRWIGGNPITDFFIINGVCSILIYFLYFLV